MLSLVLYSDVFFSVILIAMLVWWTWKCGYCDGKYLLDQSRISGTTSEVYSVLSVL